MSESALDRAVKRAEAGQFREYWLQRYVAHRYQKLGFTSLEGPFDTGYDFIGQYEGKRVVVEVETIATHFIYHGHDVDDVDMLVVLHDDSESPREILGESSTEWREKLPQHIEVVDPRDFIPETHRERRDYALAKQGERDVMEATFPLLAIGNALTVLYQFSVSDQPADGTTEARRFANALQLTAMEYAELHQVSDRGYEPVFTVIEVAANKLLKSQPLSDGEVSEIERWVGVLDSEYNSPG